MSKRTINTRVEKHMSKSQAATTTKSRCKRVSRTYKIADCNSRAFIVGNDGYSSGIQYEHDHSKDTLDDERKEPDMGQDDGNKSH